MRHMTITPRRYTEVHKCRSFRPPLVLAVAAIMLFGYSSVKAGEDLWRELQSGRVFQANFYQAHEEDTFGVYAYPTFLTAPPHANVPIFAKMTGRTEGGSRILILSDGPDFSQRGNQLQLTEKEYRQLYVQNQRYVVGRPMVVYGRTTSTYSMAELLEDPRILEEYGLEPEGVSQWFQAFLDQARALEEKQMDRLLKLTKEDLGMDESFPDDAGQRLHAVYERGQQVMKTVEIREGVTGVFRFLAGLFRFLAGAPLLLLGHDGAVALGFHLTSGLLGLLARRVGLDVLRCADDDPNEEH